MREIKFRVWHLDDGMLFFDFDTFKKDYHDQYGNIMQFTGLKDKWGVDIYEGDICKGQHDFGPAKFLGREFIVRYDRWLGYRWNYWDRQNIEVIGNIHEAKEVSNG